MSSPEGSLPDLAQFYALNEGTRIAEGGDSVVHKVGGFVVKEYKPFIHIDQLSQYQKATGQVEASLVADPLTHVVLIGDEEWTARYFANPILEVLQPQHTSDVARAVSRYVPGPNGNDLIAGPNVHTGRLYKQLAELGDTSESRLLGEIGMRMSDPKFKADFLRSTISTGLIGRIREVTGVRNLMILSILNIKFRANLEDRTLSLMVTDFANDLEDLIFP